MINTDKYKITNSRIIGQVLPFFVRGKNVTRFLEGIASPLISLHDAFRKWGLERLIEASITSQPMSLVWYLNHVFRDKFANPLDTFSISTDNLEQNAAIWYIREQIYHEEYSPYMKSSDSDDMTGDVKELSVHSIEDGISNANDIIIYAPIIEYTSSYGEESYKNEIRSKVDKYVVCDINYVVIIQE